MSKNVNRHPTDLLPDYVLGLLEPAETAAVEAHLGSCATCQEEVRQLSEPFVILTEALPPEPPRERVWQAIQAQIAQERGLLPEIAAPAEARGQEEQATLTPPPPAPQRYTWQLTTVAALLLAVGSLVWGTFTTNNYQQVRAEQRLVAERLADPQVQKVSLENVIGSSREQPLGSVLVAPESTLFVLGEDAPGDLAYQAWGHTSSDWDPEQGEVLTSLGVFKGNVFEVTSAGFASLYLSLEPTGGSPQPTDPLSKVSLLNPRSSSVEISSPEPGTTVNSDQVILSGVVNEQTAELSYTLNGGEAGEIPFANNRFTVTVTGLVEGENRLEVTSTNNEGEVSTTSVTVAYAP